MSIRNILKTMAFAVAGFCFTQGAFAAPWFESPVLKGTMWATNAVSDNVDPHYMNISEDEKYLGIVFQSSGNKGPACLYRVADLKALNGPVSNRMDVGAVWNTTLTAQGCASGNTSGIKGCAVCSSRNLMLLGNGGPATFTNMPGLLMTNIQNRTWTYPVTAIGLTKADSRSMDGIDFSDDGSTLYSDVYNGTGTKTNIAQWTVSTSNTLDFVKSWDASVKRVRCVNAYFINGQDWLFYGEGGSTISGAIVGQVYASNSNGVNTLLCNVTTDDPSLAAGETNDIMNVKLSGIGTGRMYMYVQLNAGPLFIYTLAFDGATWTTTFVKKYTFDEIKALTGMTTSRYRNFEVLNDSSFAFFAPSSARIGQIAVVTTPTAPSTTFWYENPVEKSTMILSSGDVHYMDKDESDQYLVANMNAGSVAGPIYLFSLPTLESLYGTNNPAKIAKAVVPAPATFGCTLIKGVAISDELNLFLPGAGGDTAAYGAFRTDVTNSTWTLNKDAFKVQSNDKTLQTDGCDFSHDSKYLYSNDHDGTNTAAINRWIVGNLNVTNNSIQLTHDYTFISTLVTSGADSIRNMNLYYIGGKDLIYYGDGNSAAGNVCVLDTTDGSETLLTNDSSLVKITNVKVTGAGTDNARLYVMSDNGPLGIYALRADGKSVTERVKFFSQAEMQGMFHLGSSFAKFRNIEFSQDGRYMFFAEGGGTGSHYAFHVFYTPDTSTASQWWNNPVVKAVVDTGATGGQPHYLNKDASDKYLLDNQCNGTDSRVLLYSLPTLKKIRGSNPLDAAALAGINAISALGGSQSIGGAVSDKLNLALTGATASDATLVSIFATNSAYTEGAMTTLVKDSTAFNVAASSAMEGMDFGSGSTYLYSSTKGSSISRWTLSGTTLTKDDTFAFMSTNVSAIAGVDDYTIDSNEYLFFGDTSAAAVSAYNVTSGKEYALVADADVAGVRQIKVSACGTQSYLYVLSSNGAMKIWALHFADGVPSVGDVQAFFTRESMRDFFSFGTSAADGWFRSFEVAGDGQYAFFSFASDVGLDHDYLFVVCNSNEAANASSALTTSGQVDGYVQASSYIRSEDTIAAPVYVPFSWCDESGIMTGTYALKTVQNYITALNRDADGDGLLGWQEYVAGLCPTNADTFMITNLVVNAGGVPDMDWSPDMGSARVYTLYGKDAMSNDWHVIQSNSDTSRFFKVKVDVSK